MGIESTIEIYEFDTQDYRNLVLKLAAKPADIYILNGFQENLVGLVRAMRTYKLAHGGNTVGTFDLLDAAKVLTPDELQGLRVITPDFNLSGSARLGEWKRRFVGKYHRTPLYTDAYAYDMIQVVGDAARRLRLPATSPQWIQALQATRIDGVTGPLAFDKNRDLILQLRIGYYDNGVLKPDPSDQGK